MRQISAFLSLSLLLACQNGNTSPGTPTDQPQAVRVEFQKEFSIHVGETAELAAPRARVTFVAVAADSRCAVDVQCVWEGDAALVFTLDVAGGSVVRDTLHTSGRGEAQSTRMTVGKVRLTLRNVAPQPRSDSPTRAEDYVATLIAEIVGE
ncbi:MAG: hypothetical protein H7Z74_09915 [Anaerolineae bacterium]|nr:hypothetical protein [Gemmatimonadaceae bacterium]